MRKKFIRDRRGDARRGAIDIYDHIDLKELKDAYLAAIPSVGNMVEGLSFYMPLNP